MADDLPRPLPWLDGLNAGPVAALHVSKRVSKSRVHLPVLGGPSHAHQSQAVQSHAHQSPAVQSQAVPSKAAATWRNRGARAFQRSFRTFFPHVNRTGSGLPARRVIVSLLWARRVSQAAFFLIFLFLLTETTFRGSFSSENADVVRLPYPVETFLLLDPFVAALTSLATHTLYAGLAWSLAVVVLTLVFGRAFCGWICPFGTLHHVISYLWPSKALKGGRRIESNRTKWWQEGKYYGMFAMLGAALFGSAWGGLFDPICVMVRSVGLGVMPALQYLGFRVAEGAALTNSRTLQSASDWSMEFLGGYVFTGEQAHFHQTWLVLSLFVGIVFLNRLVPRFWCRALCPLGAFLGVLSRFSIVGMEKDHSKCTDCNLCLVDCQGADSPQGGVKHRRDECHMCFNCEVACPEDVIKFRWFPGMRSTTTKPDLTRRASVASAVAGAITVPSARIANWPDKAYSPKVIRPPGSVEEKEFLERCIRCAECMKVCPNNALHPAFFEAGPEGVWTPLLIPRIGYCEHSCVLCGQVCPTGAIQKIEEAQKLGQGVKAISIGTAMFDRGRCLPWAMATPCTVCEEFCPTSPKAIWVEEVEVPTRGAVSRAGEAPTASTVVVKRPHVDPQLCIGCGACENVCPVVDRPAVYVTSAGETRSKTNVILLENSAYTST